MKLTIVGNGVSGSSLTRAAVRRGHSVVLVSRGQPAASRASLAVLRMAYLTAEADAKLALALAVDRYREAGCDVLQGAETFRSDGASKVEQDWWAVDPTNWILDPDQLNLVLPGQVDRGADYTIHCTGAALPGSVLTYGTTWYNPDPEALGWQQSLRVARWAPYRTDDAAAYRTGCRLGSTSSTTVDGARKHAVAQFLRAVDRGWIAKHEGWLLLSGARAKNNIEHWQDAAEPRLWRFGGFHRSGWSLAPIRAEQLLDRMEAAPPQDRRRQ